HRAGQVAQANGSVGGRCDCENSVIPAQLQPGRYPGTARHGQACRFMISRQAPKMNTTRDSGEEEVTPVVAEAGRKRISGTPDERHFLAAFQVIQANPLRSEEHTSELQSL